MDTSAVVRALETAVPPTISAATPLTVMRVVRTLSVNAMLVLDPFL